MFFSIWKNLKKRGVIGMNYRNIELIGMNNQRSNYPLVDNKLLTKAVAQKVGIATPELYATIISQSQVKNLEEILAPYASFVIKPAHGSGGKGIVVVIDKKDDLFIKSSGDTLTLRDLKSHISNTLSGLYSLGGRYDSVIVEKLVEFDPIFENYSYEGVPDIRVIVYRGYPVMAMMRCPTQESDGKANLHQGAVGVGIDLRSGKAINAVMHNRPVKVHPDTGHSFDDLQIPKWRELLDIASHCYEISKLGYIGVDIVFDKERGPLLLELNARPGLAIQMANNEGLQFRINTINEQTHFRSPKECVDFSMNELLEKR